MTPTSHEPATLAWTRAIFEQGGHLETLLGLQHRPQQTAMALQVASSMCQSIPLLFEAGTGIGKSLAYLIPGIIHAKSHARTLVVSTHTKALQEQIETKDLAICRQLFSRIPQLAHLADFRTVLLVGRGNYLCTTRLAQALVTRTELFASQEQAYLERIAHWATQTQTGMLEELTPPPSMTVWDWVNADSVTCNKKNCSSSECFFQSTRLKLKDAQVVIVNHSLLFALLSAGASPQPDVPGVLFADDFLVLDEAHRVPSIATEHFGHKVSSFGIELALKALYNPNRRKGLLMHHGYKEDWDLVSEALMLGEVFFNDIDTRYLQNTKVTRIHEPNWIAADAYIEVLKKLLQRLGTVISLTHSEKAKDELQSQRLRLQGYMHSLRCCIDLSPEGHVHWVEATGRTKRIVHVRSAPIAVGPYLQEHIFERHTSVVATSATLAVNRNMERFSQQIGGQNALTGLEASPFDYESSVRIYIATDAPMPSKPGVTAEVEYALKMLTECIQRVAGGTLVLFTSYAEMNAVSQRLPSRIQRPLYVQGLDYGRRELTEHFAAKGNAVLLGTDSFWTGVDVPGPALSQVIIMRLPFMPPTHPIQEAQSQAIQAKGGNPFMQLTLPEAVIQFRQGLGRLIRQHSDQGILTILDSRILYKNYGQWFLNALPKKEWHPINQTTIASVFQSFEAAPCKPTSSLQLNSHSR